MTSDLAEPPNNDWPEIPDIGLVEAENVKVLLERADALLKAQDDGLKAMEARMGSLFGQSITLASKSWPTGATSTVRRSYRPQQQHVLTQPPPISAVRSDRFVTQPYFGKPRLLQYESVKTLRYLSIKIL
jgi:hypothetical protein